MPVARGLAPVFQLDVQTNSVDWSDQKGVGRPSLSIHTVPRKWHCLRAVLANAAPLSHACTWLLFSHKMEERPAEMTSGIGVCWAQAPGCREDCLQRMLNNSLWH